MKNYIPAFKAIGIIFILCIVGFFVTSFPFKRKAKVRNFKEQGTYWHYRDEYDVVPIESFVSVVHIQDCINVGDTIATEHGYRAVVLSICK